MTFYRIGCIILILTGLMHLSSHFMEQVAENDTEKQLLELMGNYEIKTAGSTFTMMGLMNGFGLWFSLSLIWLSVLSLFLAKQLSENKPLVRKIATMNASALLMGTVISLQYFFIIPTTCLALGLIFFSIAAIRLK